MNGDLGLVCAACGDRIGVYERFWRQNPDGTVVSPRDTEPTEASGRLIHDSCLSVRVRVRGLATR